MKIARLLLMGGAVVVFALAAFEVQGQRVNLVALGLAFAALAELLTLV